MISVDNARDILNAVIPNEQVISLPLLQALGYTLAQDIIACTDIPLFPQSSMDGYAIAYPASKEPLEITGKMQAGTSQPQTIMPGQAMRIFTGAPLPDGADTVVMQEKVVAQDGYLVINDNTITSGQHVRPRGAEVKKDELAMEAGTLLSPAAIGFLAGIGCTEAVVYAPPSVTIILTGDELQQPGQLLAFGQVYESNSVQLTAALQKTGIRTIHTRRARDIDESIYAAISGALAESELILVTGGVSVGDYDLVIPNAEKCRVQPLFHKIKQKPGKPLFFGRKDDKIVFGLPGNPSSVLTCFYEYVLPLIERWMHIPHKMRSTEATVTHAYQKTKGLTHFIKAVYHDGKVTPLHAQESFRLHSFATANAFIVLPEDSNGCAAGDIVDTHILSI